MSEQEKTFEKLKIEVDSFTHEEMCSMWRFGSSRTIFFDNTTLISKYFQDRLFVHFGGFTPEISKKIGW